MKKFNVKEHTNKYMKVAKEAAKGAYPNKKVARAGSKIGLGVGGALVCVGIYGLTQSAVFGIGSFIAGVLTIISNIVNLRRISSRYTKY